MECQTSDIHYDIVGIIESDDIAGVSLEIEKALNFSKKAAMLVESVKKKYGDKYGQYVSVHFSNWYQVWNTAYSNESHRYQ